MQIAPGRRQSLDASGNIHPVAIDVALIDDDVTDVDTDAELDPTIFGNGSVTLGKCHTLASISAGRRSHCAQVKPTPTSTAAPTNSTGPRPMVLRPAP